VFGAVISSSVMLTMERYDRHEEVAHAVVAGHIRSLLAPQPFDVASSDRHTVKPWFTSRLPESPQVPDLAAQGFVLVGGRVDVVGHDPVATIVYKHAKHTVSLTTLHAVNPSLTRRLQDTTSVAGVMLSSPTLRFRTSPPKILHRLSAHFPRDRRRRNQIDERHRPALGCGVAIRNPDGSVGRRIVYADQES